MIPDKAEIDQVIAEGKEFKALISEFNEDVEYLASQSAEMHTIFAPLDDKDSQLAEIFREYRAFRGELAGNHANCSLDFEQYDNDEQAFLGSLNDMAGKQTQFINVCNEVIDRYNLLIAEVEKTMEEWNKCNGMLEMVSLLGVTPHDITRICLN